jgi:hypothetical protein
METNEEREREQWGTSKEREQETSEERDSNEEREREQWETSEEREREGAGAVGDWQKRGNTILARRGIGRRGSGNSGRLAKRGNGSSRRLAKG